MNNPSYQDSQEPFFKGLKAKNLHSQSPKPLWNPWKIQELRDRETLQDSLDPSPFPSAPRRLYSPGSPYRLQRRNKAPRRAVIELTSWRYRRPRASPRRRWGVFYGGARASWSAGATFFTTHEEGFMQSSRGRSYPEQKAGARVPCETFFRKIYWDLMCSWFCGVSINWTRIRFQKK